MTRKPQDFEPLRRLLTLKRHEQAPPGYFAHFSDKVIARIEAQGLAVRGSWWRRFLANLDAKPVFVCTYGVLIGGLLIAGVGVSQSFDTEVTSDDAFVHPWYVSTSPLPPAPVPAPELASETLLQPSLRQPDSSSSFNPVISSGAPSFLFNPQNVSIERASHTVR